MGALGYGVMGIGMVMMLGFWVLVIVAGGGLVLILARGSQPGAPTGRPTHVLQADQDSQDPLAILKLRYARGEITRQQFEELKSELGT